MPRREPNQPLNSTPNAEAGPRRTSSPLPLGRQCFGFHLSQRDCCSVDELWLVGWASTPRRCVSCPAVMRPAKNSD